MRTELGGATARTPELHRQSNAMEIERSNPTLPLLPTRLSRTEGGDQGLPTRAVPERVGEPTMPDSPKGSFHLTWSLSGAKWQGAFQWLQ